MMPDHIYLDFNASTPIAPEVAEAMQPFLTQHFGNPSSLHWAGMPAKGRSSMPGNRWPTSSLVNRARSFYQRRERVQQPCNQGRLLRFTGEGQPHRHDADRAPRHPQSLPFSGKTRATVTYVGVDRNGMVDPHEIEKAVTPKTILITVMHANNEVGTIQPIEEIAKVAKSCGVLFHTDAAQTLGKIATRVDDLGVDLLSLAGHKIYAPKA